MFGWYGPSVPFAYGPTICLVTRELIQVSRGMDTAVARPPPCGTCTSMIVSVLIPPPSSSVPTCASSSADSGLPSASVRASDPTSRKVSPSAEITPASPALPAASEVPLTDCRVSVNGVGHPGADQHDRGRDQQRRSGSPAEPGSSGAAARGRRFHRHRVRPAAGRRAAPIRRRPAKRPTTSIGRSAATRRTPRAAGDSWASGGSAAGSTATRPDRAAGCGRRRIGRASTGRREPAGRCRGRGDSPAHPGRPAGSSTGCGVGPTNPGRIGAPPVADRVDPSSSFRCPSHPVPFRRPRAREAADPPSRSAAASRPRAQGHGRPCPDPVAREHHRGSEGRIAARLAAPT